MAEVDTTTEIWKSITGYEGYYSVSSLGRIRRDTTSRILRIDPASKTYPQVHLSKNREHKVHRVHCLVASAFLGPCPDGYEVNHKDGNKRNNHDSNLEYLTRPENGQHAARTGLFSFARLSAADIPVIRSLLESQTSKQVAALFNVSPSNIDHIKKRRTWGHVS